MCGFRGVSLEKHGTPVQSSKFRVLLVRREILDQLKELKCQINSDGKFEINADGKFVDEKLEAVINGIDTAKDTEREKDHMAYKRNRLQHLWTLKRLFDEQADKNRLFLIGSVMLSMAVAPNDADNASDGEPSPQAASAGATNLMQGFNEASDDGPYIGQECVITPRKQRIPGASVNFSSGRRSRASSAPEYPNMHEPEPEFE